ncbi:hypothetical protein NL108_014950 [Boleophthalmus pectinirostris]|nr:hypothetical protein NL108_014950 [Boleophthalmus pectinirostris]
MLSKDHTWTKMKVQSHLLTTSPGHQQIYEATAHGHPSFHFHRGSVHLTYGRIQVHCQSMTSARGAHFPTTPRGMMGAAGPCCLDTSDSFEHLRIMPRPLTFQPFVSPLNTLLRQSPPSPKTPPHVHLTVHCSRH